MVSMPTALFVSAGGYHHHLGANTWHSQGAPPAPEDTARLQYFTIIFAGEGARSDALVRLSSAGIATHRDGDVVTAEDPSANRLRLVVLPN
jgi:catechol 2,3-dioxygenase